MTQINKRQTTSSERFWEILPGALEWTTFGLLILLSWLAPVVISYFIMLYSLIWLEKSVHSSAHLIHTFRKLRLARQTPWDARLAELSDVPRAIQQIKERTSRHVVARPGRFSNNYARWSAEHKHLRRRLIELEQLVQRTDLIDWRSVWHVVLFPTYNEPTEVLIQSIQSVQQASFDHKRVIVIVGIEERAGQSGLDKARVLKERFGSIFADFITVVHPDGIKGEAKVKSANATYALWQSIPELKKLGIALDKVIVSNFDSDTQMAPEYLNVLTEAFVVTPNRLRTSYQPVPVFNNNIWQAPMMARLSATGTSFWQMIESSRSHRLVSFSSHAVPLTAVIDVNGWDVTRISEDSRIFWQCYMRYEGDYHVVP
ncbi:MAG: glycosyltransferase family 2 protein, partial [bacterium]|nr:glycosyltransferase family 2 protein [bacterium]